MWHGRLFSDITIDLGNYGENSVGELDFSAWAEIETESYIASRCFDCFHLSYDQPHTNFTLNPNTTKSPSLAQMFRPVFESPKWLAGSSVTVALKVVGGTGALNISFTPTSKPQLHVVRIVGLLFIFGDICCCCIEFLYLF